MNSLFSTAVLLVSLFCFVPFLVDATWTPAIGDSFFIDLASGDSVSLTTPGTAATVYDVNGTSTSQTTVAALKALGIAVVCYVPIGAASSTDADYASFPSSALGNTVVFAGVTYKYLDVTNTAIYPVIQARIDAAAAKGCDGIDMGFDAEYGNATSGTNTGFSLTVDDAVLYYKNKANYARIKGLVAGLRDGGLIVPEVVIDFADFAIVTNCFYEDRTVAGAAACRPFKTFIANGKPVFAVENFLKPSKYCRRANKKQFFAGTYPSSYNGTYAWCSSLVSGSLSPSVGTTAAVSPSVGTSAAVSPSTAASVAVSPSTAASASVAASTSASPSLAPSSSPSAPASVSVSASGASSPSSSASSAASPSTSLSTSVSGVAPSVAASVAASVALSPSPGTSPSAATSGATKAYCITCANSCGDNTSPLYAKCTGNLNGTATFPTTTSFCCAADISNGFSYTWSATGSSCSPSPPDHKLGDLCAALGGTVSCAPGANTGKVKFTCS